MKLKMKKEKKAHLASSSCCIHVKKKWPVALLFLSFSVLFLIVFFKWVALDWIIEAKITEQIRLMPGSDTWNKWANITVPIYLKFYLFNVTNPLEVMNGAKPRLKEVGPYVYEEKRVKKILAVDKEKDTVTYRQPIYYYFRSDLSSGSERDRVIVINVPFVSLAKHVKQMTNLTIAYGIADRSLRQRGERLFVFNTVKEYLFDGYSVQNTFISFLSNPLLSLVGGAVKIPESLSGGKFGFYKGKNGTDDGEIVIRTGITNPQEFGRIMSWNSQTKLTHWSGLCNQINGTDGTLNPPFITKETILRYFVPDLCRSVYMIFGNESEYKGIKSYKFGLPNPKVIFSENDFCFCPNDKNMQCYKQGVFSLSPCKEKAPVAVSAPHFYQAYEPYLKAVRGLNPNKKDHDTYLEIEPKTGLIMHAAKRLQFNIELERNPFMSTFAKVPSLLFPIFWVEETSDLSDSILGDIKSQLYDSVNLAEQISLGGLVGCSFVILLGILACLIVTCPGKRDRSTIQPGFENSMKSNGSKESLSRSSSISSANTVSTISRNTIRSETKSVMTMTDHKMIYTENDLPQFNHGEMQEKISRI